MVNDRLLLSLGTDSSEKEPSERDSSEEFSASVDGLSRRISSGLLWRKSISNFYIGEGGKIYFFRISLSVSESSFSDRDSSTKALWRISWGAISDNSMRYFFNFKTVSSKKVTIAYEEVGCFENTSGF